MRKKKKKIVPGYVPGSAHATEFDCGCITHPVAGNVRKCGAMPSRSLSGKPSKLEGDVSRHTNAEPVRYYPVANILP
jgi:hypothetical protein